MSTIVTRAGKGSALTHNEVDANFTNLNTDKLQSGNTAAALTITSATIAGGTIDGTTVGASSPASGSFTSLTDSGNLTFTGTGNRITGDFSNSTVANRVAFQSSTTNGSTAIIAIPNGTATDSSVQTFNNSNPTNSTRTTISTSATEGSLQVSRTGSGTYLPMTFYTGGSEAMRINTSGLLQVGSSNLLGSGLNYQLQIGGTSAQDPGIGIAKFATSGNSVINLGRSRNTTATLGAVVQDDDILGLISFTGDTGSAWLTAAQIFSAVDGTPGSNDMPGRLVFSTRPDGVAQSLTERMRIDSSGNVGINTTSPDIKLDVVGGTTSGAVDDTLLLQGGVTGVVGSGAALYLSGGGGVTRAVEIAGVNTGGANNAHAMVFSTSAATAAPVERMRISSTGLTTLASGSGLSISATGVTSPAAGDGNVFSGTYTPTLTNSTNVAASTAAICQYMRVGNVVTVSGQVSIDVTTTATDSVLLMTLPIASTFAASRQCGGTAASSTAGVYGTETITIMANVANGSAEFRLRPTSVANLDYRFSFTYSVI
jgi:hypothetical protein